MVLLALNDFHWARLACFGVELCVAAVLHLTIFHERNLRLHAKVWKCVSATLRLLTFNERNLRLHA